MTNLRPKRDRINRTKVARNPKRSIAVGTVLVLAFITYAGAKAAKSVGGKAKKQCAGALDKGACVRDAKKSMYDVQINIVKGNMDLCASTTKPDKCKAKLKKKIDSLQKKKAKLG